MIDNHPTIPCEPPDDCPDSGHRLLEHEQSGTQNADVRTFGDVRCSLAEFDDLFDDVRRWYVRCRDERDDEEIIVEQDLWTLRLTAHGEPERFHVAAIAFVKSEPECKDGQP